LRELFATHKDFAKKLEEMVKKYDQQFKLVCEAIRQLLTTPDSVQEKPKRQIGFRVAESKSVYAPEKSKKMKKEAMITKELKQIFIH